MTTIDEIAARLRAAADAVTAARQPGTDHSWFYAEKLAEFQRDASTQAVLTILDEIDRLRDDLAEAVALLAIKRRIDVDDEWLARRDALLAKHPT